ncbi:MAG: ABC transporter family substrate-binding protein [Actinomycetales bacterium]|nr:ABC transporter family substrate-binding protein [Actinomycetales bacterium]
MKIRRFSVAGAVLASAALVLSACTTPAPEGDTPTTTDPAATESPTDGEPSGEATTVTVGWNQPFYSYNSDTSHGNATANAIILYMTQSGFNYYDADLNLAQDTSFGTYEKLSDDPLTVKYTINEGVVWSDDTPVDAADMLLYWAAVSGNFNDEVEIDEETGEEIIGENQVYFTSESPGLALVTQTPEIGDDGRSVTLVYDKPFADWETNFGYGVPAHVTQRLAGGSEDAAAAKDEVIAAIQAGDKAALAPLADAWRTGFDFTSLPSDAGLYLSSGPYIVTDFVENQYITLTKNAKYTGDKPGKTENITVRYNEDPQALVQALQNGEIDMLAPQATADTLAALQAIDGVTVETGQDATYEHVDMVVNNGGPFDPASYGGDAEKAKKVRQAFLLTIPRQQIVEQLIQPLNPEAAVRNSFILTPDAPGYPQMVEENGSDFYAQQDIEKAKSLLAEAGVDSVDVRFLYGASNVRRAQEYQLIAESAAEAGINVIDGGNDNWGTMLDTAQDQYDANLFGWQSTSLAVTEADANFRTKATNNFYGYSNEAVDALFDELQVEVDANRQQEILREVEKHLWADAFGITIFQFPGVNAWNSNVAGVDPIPLSPTIFHGFWNWEKTS